MLAANIKTVRTRHGDMSIYVDDVFVGHCLEKYGEYSEAEVALWRRLIPVGAIVVDVGANIGALTVPLADIVRDQGKVYAFEPQPENYELLKRNVAGLPQVLPIPAALGDHDGSINIPYLASLDHHNYGDVTVARLDQEYYRAPLQQLDDRLDAESGIAFIKIDVQGMEAAVIRGAAKIIERDRPLLYVENEQASVELCNLLYGLDYRLWAHCPPLYPPGHDEPAEIVSINMLAVPRACQRDLRDVLDGLRMIVPPPKSVGRSQWACVVRLGGIGDNLIAASVLRPLSRRYKIDVITQMPQAVVFENNPFVTKLSIRERPKVVTGGQEWQDIWKARAEEYDLLVNLSHSVEGLLALFKGSTQYYWPPAFRRQLCGRSYVEIAHDIVGVEYEFGPVFFPTEEETEQALATRRKAAADRQVVGWCISGSRVDKVYPQTAMAIARLIKELDVDVIIFGGPPPGRDYMAAVEIQESVKFTLGNLTRVHAAISADAERPTWPIRRLLTQVGVCDLVIGPDTGPMWSVAWEDIPKIVLHSHASVDNIAKHWLNTVSMRPAASVKCHPCHQLHDSKDDCQTEQRRCGLQPNDDDRGAACITSISVEDIIETAAKLLGGSNANRA